MYGSEFRPTSPLRHAVDKMITAVKVGIGLPTDAQIASSGKKELTVEQQITVEGDQLSGLIDQLTKKLAGQGQKEMLLLGNKEPESAEYWRQRGPSSEPVEQIKLLAEKENPAIFYLEIKRRHILKSFTARRLVFERKEGTLVFNGVEFWSKGGLTEAKDGLGNGFEKPIPLGWYQDLGSRALADIKAGRGVVNQALKSLV